MSNKLKYRLMQVTLFLMLVAPFAGITIYELTKKGGPDIPPCSPSEVCPPDLR